MMCPHDTTRVVKHSAYASRKLKHARRETPVTALRRLIEQYVKEEPQP
jgi:hypothetical protein